MLDDNIYQVIVMGLDDTPGDVPGYVHQVPHDTRYNFLFLKLQTASCFMLLLATQLLTNTLSTQHRLYCSSVGTVGTGGIEWINKMRETIHRERN